MISCFVCSFDFGNPQDLCTHIKKSHQKEKSYRCTICTHTVFTDMWKYRRHLDLCLNKIPARNTSSKNVTTNHRNVAQEHLLKFEESIDSSALFLVCKLASDMSIPRNHVFQIISEYQSFLSSNLLEGLKKFVEPHMSDDQKANFAYIMQIFENPFKSVETECKLDDVLKKADLISPLKEYEIKNEIDVDNLIQTKKPKLESKKSSKKRIDPVDPSEKEYGTIMPLKFQFKKFFELPNVFEITQNYAKVVSEDKTISHFTNAGLWKQKLKSFESNELVIPFHLHIDETQVNNALGTHRSKGLETCTYYTFPTIPPQYSSRLENVFAAQLFSAGANKKFGNHACFNDLITELNKMAQEQITLNIDGREEKVYFVLGLVLGDNKGLNDACGFAKSHNSKHFCRFCRMHIKQTRTATIEMAVKLRNKINYLADLRKKDFGKTGISENSIVNSFHLCHATDSIGIDIMHDMFEGILHYNMSEIILHFIQTEDCSLEKLNQLKFDLSYGDIESGNKSPPITMNRLNAKKLLMSASEMQSFVHHYGLIVGDVVPKEDAVWKFYLKMIEFVDLMFLPSYAEEDLFNLKITISEMNSMYIKLFKQKLKPKHHYVTHYPTMIRRFGPLYFISSMKFEAKHKIVKNYTKNTASRLNLSHSIGRKLQYNFACRLLSKTGLIDKVIMGSSHYINLKVSDIFQRLENSQQMQQLLLNNTKETKHVIINGIKFSTKLNIILKENNKIQLYKIMKIIHASEKISGINFVCEQYKSVSFNENFQCYQLDTLTPEPHLKLINAVKALNERQYPVALHAMANNIYRFRAKSF